MIRVVLVAVVLACGGSQPRPAPAAPPPAPDAGVDAAVVVDAPAGSGSAVAEVPAECQAYLDALAKLQACAKLPPDSKAAMASAVEQLKAGLPQAMAASPEARAQVIAACTQGAKAVTHATASAGC